MKMFSNDFEWVIAETKEDAIEFMAKYTGYPDYVDEDWYECDPVEKFTLTTDKGTKIYGSFGWFVEHYPAGFFASSEF